MMFSVFFTIKQKRVNSKMSFHKIFIHSVHNLLLNIYSRFIILIEFSLPFFFYLFVTVQFRHIDGHIIHYVLTGKKIRLFINQYPFCRDTKKHGWIYWRCVGYRKTGFVCYEIVIFQSATRINCFVIIFFQLPRKCSIKRTRWAIQTFENFVCWS